MNLFSQAEIKNLLRPCDESVMQVSLAIADTRGEVSSHVSGHWPSGRPVSAHDKFYGASLTKQLTGVAIAKLIVAGRLDVGAPVASILLNPSRWARDCTIEQLLHHTAGLPGQGVLEDQLNGEDWTDAAVMALLEAAPASSQPPGNVHAYSNAGYVVLARVVECISGQPFPQFISQFLVEWEVNDLVVSDGPDRPASEQWAMLGKSRPLSTGDGGVWTSAAGFASWLHAQNRDRMGVEHLVTRSGLLNDGTAVPYVWGIGLRGNSETPIYIHGGSWQGATAKAMRCPENGLCVVGLAAGSDSASIIPLVDTIFARLGNIA